MKQTKTAIVVGRHRWKIDFAISQFDAVNRNQLIRELEFDTSFCEENTFLSSQFSIVNEFYWFMEPIQYCVFMQADKQREF